MNTARVKPKENISGAGSFWLKTSGHTKERPSNSHEPPPSNLSSSSSSLSESTGDLEGYINDIKSLGDLSPDEDIRQNHEALVKAANELRGSPEDSCSSDHSYSVLHGNILSLEDLVMEEGVNSSSSQPGKDLFQDKNIDSFQNMDQDSSTGPPNWNRNQVMGTSPELATVDDYSEPLDSETSDEEEIEGATLLPNVRLVTDIETLIADGNHLKGHSHNETSLVNQEQDSSICLSSGSKTDSRIEEIKEEGEEEVETEEGEMEGNIGDHHGGLSVDNNYSYSMEFDSDIITTTDEEDENISMPGSSPQQRPAHLKDCSVQTDEMMRYYHPDPLLHNHTHLNHAPSSPTSLNPTPLLPHVIRPEDLNGATPPVIVTGGNIALQDMVRSQITLTRHFIEHSKRLSEHLAGDLVADHHYVTLNQTKEFIASNKPKTITYEEAMKMVRKGK